MSELTFDKERLVDVSWGDFKPSAHSVRISVRTEDKPGLLASVSSSISALDANITHAEASVDGNREAMLFFTIDVNDIEHLNKVIKSIEDISGVLQVKRVKTA